MQQRERFRMLGIAILVCAAAASAQTVGPQAIKNRLLEARANEIRLQYQGNNDAEAAIAALMPELKRSDMLKTTVVKPCPRPPSPKPRGRVPKIADEGVWPTIVGPEAIRLADTAGAGRLTPEQRRVLTNDVAPQFASPGDAAKFTTIVMPICGTPSPKPSPRGDGREEKK
jgi:hypothetical protein